MTKDRAIHAWFEEFAKQNSLGLYAETAVPDVATLPYMTYTYSAGSMGDMQVPITVNIWMRTTSEAIPNDMAEKFRKYVNENDRINCDGGCVYVYTGEPFCINQSDQTDRLIKLRYINLMLDFCTE